MRRVRRAAGRRRALLPVLRRGGGTGAARRARGAEGRDGAVRRRRGLDGAGRAPRPGGLHERGGGGRATDGGGRRDLRRRGVRARGRRAAGAVRRTRRRTRTTPSARCSPACGSSGTSRPTRRRSRATGRSRTSASAWGSRPAWRCSGRWAAASKVEYTAMGDSINTAARLQAAAEAGMVLVGAQTQRLIAAAFAWGEARASCGSRARPSRSWPTRCASSQGLPAAAPDADRRSALVGRDAELAAAAEAVDAVLARVGRRPGRVRRRGHRQDPTRRRAAPPLRRRERRRALADGSVRLLRRVAALLALPRPPARLAAPATPTRTATWVRRCGCGSRRSSASAQPRSSRSWARCSGYRAGEAGSVRGAAAPHPRRRGHRARSPVRRGAGGGVPRRRALGRRVVARAGRVAARAVRRGARPPRPLRPRRARGRVVAHARARAARASAPGARAGARGARGRRSTRRCSSRSWAPARCPTSSSGACWPARRAIPSTSRSWSDR